MIFYQLIFLNDITIVGYCVRSVLKDFEKFAPRIENGNEKELFFAYRHSVLSSILRLVLPSRMSFYLHILLPRRVQLGILVRRTEFLHQKYPNGAARSRSTKIAVSWHLCGTFAAYFPSNGGRNISPRTYANEIISSPPTLCPTVGAFFPYFAVSD